MDGYSLDAQKSRIKAFCDFNDYEIAGEYEDAGNSGKSIDGRVAFNQMMEVFLTMFGNMIFQTYLVAAGAESLKEAIKLLWMFRIPWGWTYTPGLVPDWVAQFSFGFYSLMLTSTIIGFVVNILFKPRTWCSFCPMGTMTQMICKLKAKEKL